MDEIRRATSQTDDPYTKADGDSDSNLSQVSEVVVRRQKTIDAQSGQREDAGELVTFAKNVGDSADSVAEDPVVCKRSVDKER